MPTANVKVKVTTNAQIRVFINMNEAVLDINKEGSVPVNVGERSLMVWMAAGDPGEPYEIELTVDAPHTLTALTGSNPVKSRISTLLFTASGHIRFIVN